MRKIFTLLAGMLLASGLTSNAMEVTVDIKDADSYTTYLTKDEDGNFVLADFLESEKPISFKFEKPAEVSGKSAITITSKTNQDDNYYDLLDAEGDYIDCWLWDYKGSGDWLSIFYPSVYNQIANTYVESLDPEESDGYEYYAKMTIYAYDDDQTGYWLYVSFYFNDPSEANQAAYDKVIADIEALDAKYKEALDGLEKEYNGIDLSEWEGIIGGQLAQVKTGASQQLAVANADLEEFNFPFDAEEYEGMIAQMQKDAPSKYAYDTVMKAIGAVDVEYKDAVDEIKEIDPDFDFADWKSIIEEQINNAKSGADAALSNVYEEGEEFTYAFDPADIEAIIIEMKKVAFADYNEEAYAKVLAEINAVEAQYNDAVKAIKAGNPEFDFTDWSEIATMIQQARSGASTAFDIAAEYGGVFNFPAGVEDIENFISEMKNADPQAYNKGAYDQVLADIQSVEDEYNDAVEEIKEVNPEFNFADWSEIADQIAQAKLMAKQALDSAEEDGEVAQFAFTSTDIEAFITEMKKAAFADYNQNAYDKVVADIAEIETKYAEAIAEIEKDYPEFDLDEWKEIIGKPLGEAKKGADQALASATEDGVAFIYPFDAETFEGMIEEMKNAAKTSGIANIESDVAAGKAMIFTLDGKSHAAPVNGQVNVIVKGNSTVKIMIK